MCDHVLLFKRRRARITFVSYQLQSRAEAPCFAPLIKEIGLLKTRFRTPRNVSAVRGGGNLAPGNFFVGHSSHREAAIRLNDVLGCRFHQMRGDAASLFSDAINSNCQGSAAHDGAASAKGADA